MSGRLRQQSTVRRLPIVAGRPWYRSTWALGRRGERRTLRSLTALTFVVRLADELVVDTNVQVPQHRSPCLMLVAARISASRNAEQKEHVREHSDWS
jgi:hypothetical protein